jgi:O-antigen ligase
MSTHPKAVRLAIGPFRENPSLLVFLAFLCYTISVYTQLGERLFFLSAIRHELILGGALSIACILLLFSSPLNTGPYRTVVIAIALLFVVMLTQIPFAANRPQAWETFFDKIFKQGLFTFFMITLIRTPRRLMYFMTAFIFSLFWVYQESFRGLITGSLVWYNQGIQRLHGAVPLYKHSNGISLIAVTSLPFLYFLFPAVRKLYLKLLILVTGALAVIIVIYSGSRAGYVGTLAILAVIWALSRHKWKSALIGLLLGAVALAVMPDQYKERFQSIGGEETEGRSREARMEIVEDAWAIFLENPLGVGVDSFTYVRMKKFGRDQYTHNLYLQVATQLGIHGFLIFMFFVYAISSSFIKVIKRLDRLEARVLALARSDIRITNSKKEMRSYLGDLRYTRWIALACITYMAMLMVNGMFAHSLYLICWWLAAGLSIVLLNLTTLLEKEFFKARPVQAD